MIDLGAQRGLPQRVKVTCLARGLHRSAGRRHSFYRLNLAGLLTNFLAWVTSETIEIFTAGISMAAVALFALNMPLKPGLNRRLKNCALDIHFAALYALECAPNNDREQRT
jgi:hypothetical protein